jgi:hypothetical protein
MTLLRRLQAFPPSPWNGAVRPFSDLPSARMKLHRLAFPEACYVRNHSHFVRGSPDYFGSGCIYGGLYGIVDVTTLTGIEITGK